MIEQATIDYMLNILKDRGLIEKGYRENIKFTDAGHTYTTKRSRDSWCDIVWSGDSLWVPVSGGRVKEDHKYCWDFINYNRLQDNQIKLFMDYFEIEPFESIIPIDIEELCL